jgi:CRP/FNR family transcriptional regulator, cyclic AMP receptor protein
VDTAELRRAAIFGELQETEAARLVAVARSQQCRKGECLFLLGDHADRLYVVLSGKVELSFPLSFGSAVRDVPVESKAAGSALGWSALVKPHRFTLSARAAERSDLATFSRQDLLNVFEAEPRIGFVVMRHIAEVVGRRLLQVEALWARELQRAVTDSLAASAEPRRSRGES